MDGPGDLDSGSKFPGILNCIGKGRGFLAT